MTIPREACYIGDSRELRPEEERARDVFGSHLNGELIAIPDPPDFAICRHGDVVGGAEVTQAVDSDRAAQDSWLRRHGDSFTTPELARDWRIMFSKDAVMNRLDREHLVRLLAAFETTIDPERLSGEYSAQWHEREAAMAFSHFGIIMAYFHPPVQGQRPAVMLDRPGFGSSVGPSLINDLAAKKAHEKSKSFGGVQGERHLLVLVNYDWPTGAGLALTNNEIPADCPELPDAITDVWLSRARSHVWHLSSATAAWDLILTT